MPHYKDSENKLHFLDDDQYSYILLPGCMVITSEEAESIRNNSESIIQLRERKLFETQKEKNRIRDGGFKVDGVLFDSDSGARIAYAEFEMKLVVNPSFSVQNWKASEGNWVTLDGALYSKVMQSGQELLNSCFTWQKEKDEAINAAFAANDISALKAISTTFK